MNRDRNALASAKDANGKLPLDVLKGIVGGASLQDKDQNVGVDHAVALTAGATLGFGAPVEPVKTDAAGKDVAQSKVGTAEIRPAVAEGLGAPKSADPGKDAQKEFRAPDLGKITDYKFKPQVYASDKTTYSTDRGWVNIVKTNASDAADAAAKKAEANAKQAATVDANTARHGAAWDDAKNTERHAATIKADQRAALDADYKNLHDKARLVQDKTAVTGQLAQKVDEATQVQARTGDKLAQAQSDLTKLQSAADGAKPKVGQAQADLAKAQDAVDAGKQKVQQTQVDHDKAQQTLKGYTDDHRAAQQVQKVDAATQAQAQAHTGDKLAQAQSDLTKLQGTADGAKTKVGQAQAELAKAQDAVGAGKQKVQQTQADHDRAQQTLKGHTDDHQAAQQALGTAKAVADAAKAKVASGGGNRGDDHDAGRDRSRSVGKVAGGYGSDEPGHDNARARANSTGGKTADVQRPAQSAPSIPVVPPTKEASVSHDTLKKAVGVAGSMVDEAGKDAAKKAGTYAGGTSGEKVLAGGVVVTSKTDGDVTRTSETIAQVTGSTVAEAYTYKNAGPGAGAKASATWTAEAGLIGKTKLQLGEDTAVTLKDKVYASVSAEAKATATANMASGLTAKASAEVAVHAEATKSATLESGIFKDTLSAGASGDAKAGASAGAHLGFDGASIEAKAAAEAAVKAGVTNDLQVGTVVTSQHAEVFAKAQAEAKAAAEVAFNPFEPNGKVKVSAGLQAEASAGVGISGGLGLKSASGNGVQGEAGVNVGGVGAHFKSDAEFKDGKLNVSVDLGAKLLIGVDLKINLKVDPGQAVQNVGKAFSEIDNFGDAVLSIPKAYIGFFTGLFG